ncbi:MAG: S-layer homology domain-containing protein [Clostridia bacterium]|nr:S-layer homology domain-containing protein [Clostridia bacterium]
MKKRILGLMLALVLLITTFASFGVMAAKENYVEAELLVNGDMELLGEAAAYWSGATIETKIVRSGERSLKHSDPENPDKKRLSVQTDIRGFIPGKAYKFTAWMYTETVFPGSKPLINIIPKDATGTTIQGTRVDVDAAPQKGKWTQVVLDFIAPDGIDYAEVQLRIDGGGTIYWDDASIIGPTTPEYKEYIEDFRQKNLDVKAQGEYYMKLDEDANLRREIAPGHESIIKNGNFETLRADGNPENWSMSNGGWGTTGVVLSGAENVHSGNNAIMITSEATGNPYAAQHITEGFETGKEYVFSAWIKNIDMPALQGAFMKFECYSDVNTRTSATATGNATSPTYVYDDHEWHQIKLIFRIPEGTKIIIPLIRMKAPGKLAYDDVEMGIAAPETVCKLDSYRQFFYTETPEGTMFAEIDNAYAPIEPGSYVEFSIKDAAGNVVASGKEEAKKTTYWTFNTSVLAEKHVGYTASANYYDASGNLIEGPSEKTIYRFDRPKRMNENGEYVDPVTGKVVYPSLIYSCTKEEEVIYAVEKLGATVSKNWVNWKSSDEEIMAMLDRAQEIGVKICFSLYTPPAGHPLTIDKVRHIAELVKDHPAVYGYMLQDEPSLHPGPSNQVKTYKQMIYYMGEGYKAIREIDPNNLVYCLESGGATIATMRSTAQCTDVFMVDPYPYNHETVKTYQILRVGQALEATGGEYKQLTLLKAAAMEAGDYEDGTVTDVAVRHQAYQTLWIGGYEYGYIPILSSKGYQIATSPFAEGIEGHTSSGEQQIIRDHFHGVNTTLVSNYQGKDVWMRSWIDGNGDMYLVLMNMTTGDVEVDIPYVSENGKFTVGEFVAKPVNGDTRTLVGNGRIQTTLSDIQVALYKVNANVDTAVLSQPVFDDMAGYEWAANAVELLNSKDIINNKGVGVYAPAENITRADFAGFIIRTLGLEEKGAENFADVDPNHEYAKEIATGKALGIFNGTGDNKFEPNAPISRQDLMTMCYRGMKTAGVTSGMVSNAWIESFTDSGAISDYAVEAIAAMIENSIVRGNGDGTVNPLGNTTRAEAAVIMERISALRPDYRRLLA